MISQYIGVLAAAEDPTLWEAIVNYIEENYFSDVTYSNLGLGLFGSTATLRNILFGLLVGVIIASFIMVFDKRVLGAFVRKLLREECLSPESAKRLCQLGFADKLTVRNGVRRGTTLRSVVRSREEEEHKAAMAEKRAEYEKMREEDPSLPPFKETEYTVDPDEDHFYIPEEKKYSAEFRFEKKGTTWLGFAAVVAVAVILFFVLLFVIPELMKLLDELVGGIKATAGGRNNILT